jgi:hypothetical protein
MKFTQGKPLSVSSLLANFSKTCHIQIHIYLQTNIFMILTLIAHSREDPYGDEPLMKVLRDVCDPSVNRRPQVPERAPQKMVDLMKKCWSADPFYR